MILFGSCRTIDKDSERKPKENKLSDYSILLTDDHKGWAAIVFNCDVNNSSRVIEGTTVFKIPASKILFVSDLKPLNLLGASSYYNENITVEKIIPTNTDLTRKDRSIIDHESIVEVIFTDNNCPKQMSRFKVLILHLGERRDKDLSLQDVSSFKEKIISKLKNEKICPI